MIKRLLCLFLASVVSVHAATEAVSIDTATKQVKNPIVKFGSGNTLDVTSATLVGFSFSFGSLTGLPTTLAGYGITDAQPLDSDLTAIASLTTDSFGRALLTKTDAASIRTYIGAGTSNFDGAFASLTGTPTTLSGYGITDAQPLDSDLTAIAALTTDSFGRDLLIKTSAANVRAYIGAGTSSFDGAFSSLTGKPTTLSGYGITDAQPLDSDLTAIAALSTTSFGRGSLALADAAAFRTYIGAGSSSFDGTFASLSGKPTTLVGYGITDAQPLDSDLTAIAALTTDSFGRDLLIKTSAANVRTYIGAGTSSFDGAFSSLTGTPTTLSGYGITDAVPSSRTLTIGATAQDLSVNRTWLANVTNDAQTKASIVPNTAPSSGQILVGDGTAYVKQTLSGSGATASLSSSGVLTLSGISNATLTNSSFTLGSTSISLGGTALTFTGLSDPTNPSDVTTKNYVDNAISAINQGTGSGVISGCGVAWSGTGLVFNVSAGTYSINGVSYSISASQVTLTTADGTNPRFDDIILTTSSTADKVTGTPAANPIIPTVDPSTQLYLTAVSVPAGATTPGNITTTLLYDENVGSPTEWNTSSTGSTWNLASTNNPKNGTKDIEATSVGTGASFTLQKGSGTIDPSTQNSFVFWIRSKAAWAANRSITITLLNAGTQFGNAVTFQNSSFGFNSSNTSSYQQIVIPLSSFSVAANVINQVKFTVAGSGGSLGFYFDTASFQAGVSSSSQNFMVWRGTWSSSTAYVKNDVVIYNGQPFVDLIANTNSTPTESNANWQAVTIETDGATGFNIENASDKTKKTIFDASNITTATTRTVNLPDANSTTAQALAASGALVLTGMSAQGVFSTGTPPNDLVGDGSDGALAFDGTNTFSGIETHTGSAPNFVYTLARDAYASSVTVSASKILNTGNFRIYCTGTVTNAGTIRNNGVDGSAGSGQTGGTAGSGIGQGTTYLNATGSGTGVGGTGGTGSATSPTGGGSVTQVLSSAFSNATASGYAQAGNSARGGDGSLTGGAGGNGATWSAPTNKTTHNPYQLAQLISHFALQTGAANTANGAFPYAFSGGQPGGGGGGGKVGSNGGGGGGASGGGVLFISSYVINNSGGTIQANGGTGGSGASSSGGVGGGGGGGIVVLLYHSITLGTEQALAGSNGSVGTTTNAGTAAVGTVIKCAY